MRTVIAPAPITPVILMTGNSETGFSPAGGNGGALSPSSQQYSTASGAIVTSDGTAGTIASGGKGFIQNLDDAAVYVKLGTGASSSSFNFVLSAGSAANDGLGGSKEIADYVGIVSIAAAAGSPRVVFTTFS